MAKLFRVRGTLEQESILWFVNRSTEPGSYALDGNFSEEEAIRFDGLLRSRNLECRIEEVPRCAGAEEPAFWNLLGRLIELEQADADQLSFRVVGCVEV